jgi:hypothetical protein
MSIDWVQRSLKESPGQRAWVGLIPGEKDSWGWGWVWSRPQGTLGKVRPEPVLN